MNFEFHRNIHGDSGQTTFYKQRVNSCIRSIDLASLSVANTFFDSPFVCVCALAGKAIAAQLKCVYFIFSQMRLLYAFVVTIDNGNCSIIFSRFTA